MAKEKIELYAGKFSLSPKAKLTIYAIMAAGLLGTAASIFFNPERGWAGYLQAFFYVTTLGIGGLFFVAINNIAKAGWSVSIRRFCEAMAAFIPVIVVGGLIIGFGAKHLYAWTDPQVIAEAAVGPKTGYLNIPFMMVRIIIFGLGALLFQRVIVGHSLQQDKDGKDSHTIKNVGISVGFVLFFAITFSVFSVDLLMSLLPTWYSTIFGVYTFAGMFQASMAFLILILLYAKNSGLVKGYVTTDHIHDCAKYMKGFTVFWAYIAFSQFMLIWYANIPEETEFFLMRAQNGWTCISVGLIFGNFVCPFLFLLPRWAKRTDSWLIFVCVWILIWHFIDIFWLVGPNFNDNQLSFGLNDVAPLVGFLGLFVFLITKFLEGNSVVPLKDPRLQEAIHHHVTY